MKKILKYLSPLLLRVSNSIYNILNYNSSRSSKISSNKSNKSLNSLFDNKYVRDEIMNKELGIWSDGITVEEKSLSTECADLLKREAPWAMILLKDHKIQRALNCTPNKERNTDETKQIKASLFEIRFAYVLHRCGYTAEYEFKTGLKNSKVDFKLNSNPDWLIELTSLRDSDATKQATSKSDNNTHNYISVTSNIENSPEVLDLIKTQKALISKVSNSHGKMIKFPNPSDENDLFNMLVIDVRALFMSDIDDYLLISYGNEYFKDRKDKSLYQRYFVDRDGQNTSIKGLFSDKHPDPKSIYIKDNIHAIMFCNEKNYEIDRFLDYSFITPNPNLFVSVDEFKEYFPIELVNRLDKKKA